MRMHQRTRSLATQSLALSITLAACGSSGAVVASEEQPTAETVADPIATTAASTAATNPATLVPATYQADATLLTSGFMQLEAATYRVESLGTPFSFAGSESVVMQLNEAGFVVITHPASYGPDDRDLVMQRVSGFSNPKDPSQLFDDPSGAWPANDFLGWINQLPDGVVVSDPEATTLGGLDAIQVDIQLDDIDCTPGPEQCVGFVTDQLVNTKFLNPGASYRIWVVDQATEAPVAIVVGTTDAEGDWFQTAEEVLTTLAFGDIGPSPIMQPPVGPVELSLLGGVMVELSPGTTVVSVLPTFGRLVVSDEPGDIEFITNPVAPGGTVIATADELVDVLRSRNTEVNEIESTFVGGIEARVFEIGGGNASTAVLLRSPDDGQGWYPPPAGQLWLLEHPERGLLMVNAEAYILDDELYSRIVARAVAALSSLEFVALD